MTEDFIAVGEKVCLRMITDMDTDLVIKWRNNERVRQNFIYRVHFTREIHENWLKTKVETGEVIQMIICENGDGEEKRPVGSVYLRYTGEDKQEAEYGIFIGEDDATGKGYGSETAALTVGLAKNEYGIKKLILRVFSYNITAIKSYESAGFVKTMDMPAVECTDGEVSDMILMENNLV